MLLYMNKNKKLLLGVAVLFGALFIAFETISKPIDIAVAKRKKLLSQIAERLQAEHYNPKKFDDEFSKKVFKKYLEQLDDDKNLFLAEDYAKLKKFETKIDDEIKGADLLFAGEASKIYNKRLDEVIQLYKEILSKPFEFNADEEYNGDASKLAYGSVAERKDRWRKRLKYEVLIRFADLQDQREKKKNEKDFIVRPDSALERIARQEVLKANSRIFDRIKSTFNEDEKFNGFINAVTETMDPHTNYFAPIDKRSFDENMSGRFYGIGAQLTQDDNGVKIAIVTPGGAAWKQGELAAGDVILKVAQGDGAPADIAGYRTEDAVKLIRGGKGTVVKLTVKKQDGSTKIITIVRDEVVLDEVYARSAVVNNGKEKIGYIYLPDFYADFERPNGARCSQDVAREVEKLKAEEVNGIVIDLRNNGGGSLYEVVQMVGLFIKQGPVVQVRDREGRSQVLNDRDPAVLYDGPLAVMVNEFSASASEIFAGAIQDYNRGIVIGSTSTYGKGTVQRSIPLGQPLDFFTGATDMGAMKLTFQKFYRVNGASTQLKGVEPDVVLPDLYEFYKFREKDNPASLPWDQIQGSAFNPWQDKTVQEATIVKARELAAANANFKVLQSNLEWLNQNSKSAVSLQLNKYRAAQEKIKSTVTQNNTLLRLQKEMEIEVTKLDKDKFYNNPDKAKGERYQQWLKNLKGDIYIDQTAKIMSQLINDKSLAAVKK